jgi:hypothetical protein
MRVDQDQQMPKDGMHDVFSRFHEYIEQRRAKGIATYGKPLQTFNGRDPLRDRLDEQLDALAYTMQEIMEREQRQKWAAELAEQMKKEPSLALDLIVSALQNWMGYPQLSAALNTCVANLRDRNIRV